MKNLENNKTNVARIFVNNQQHPYHIVSPSPWPILLAFSLYNILFYFVLWMHAYTAVTSCFFVKMTLALGVFGFVYSIISWFWDIIIEATFEGAHTLLVQRGLRIGFSLFIVSEIIFFFSFFWAFFYFSISPSIWLGSVWPPLGIAVVDPWALPYLNTWILLFSGVMVTLAHKTLITRKMDSLLARNRVIATLFLTIYLGLYFTMFQLHEYTHCSFAINDGVYGSIFYMLTGFHGFHVLIGTLFLYVCWERFLSYHFTRDHHLGLEMAIWYWHFVDVIWIFLFIFVYVWGSY